MFSYYGEGVTLTASIPRYTLLVDLKPGFHRLTAVDDDGNKKLSMPKHTVIPKGTELHDSRGKITSKRDT